jgi:hypothetical protein
MQSGREVEVEVPGPWKEAAVVAVRVQSVGDSVLVHEAVVMAAAEVVRAVLLLVHERPLRGKLLERRSLERCCSWPRMGERMRE